LGDRGDQGPGRHGRGDDRALDGRVHGRWGGRLAQLDRAGRARLPERPQLPRRGGSDGDGGRRFDLSRWPRAAAAWGSALLAACSAASPTSSSPAPGFSAGPGAAARTDWPAYHRTPDRAGALKGGPFHGAAVAWQSDELDGDVYGSPLVVGGRALVATENNTVYAFDAASGGLLSSRHLGAPVDAGSLPC